MKLKSFSCKGLTVFKDLLFVNFEQLPEGLIAVVGPNGGGKSSLIEGIYASLYREMPSHGTLYQNCSGRDAFLQLRFEMDDKPYMASVLVDAVSEKQEAYLVSGTTPLVNGKLMEYGLAIQKIVGSPRMMLSSVFNAQTRKGSFIALPVADRKTLFIEMLGLGNCPVIEKRAKEAAAINSSNAINLRVTAVHEKALVDQADDVTRQGVECRQQAAALRATSAAVDACRTEAQQALERLDEELAEEKSLRDGLVKAGQEWEARQKQHTALVIERSTLTRAISKERESLLVGVENLSAKAKELDGKITWHQGVLARREEIERAMNHRFELGLRAKALGEEFDEGVQADRRRQENERKAQGLTHLREQVLRNIDMCEIDAEELVTIPCHGKAPYDRCPKILRSVESRNRLPELRDQLRDVVLAEDAWCRIVVQERPLDEIRAELRSVEGDYESSSTYLVLQSELVTAGTRLLELDDQLNDVCKQRTQMLDRLDTLNAGNDRELLQCGVRIEQKLAEIEFANEAVDWARSKLSDLSSKAQERTSCRVLIARMETESRDYLAKAAGLESTAEAAEHRLVAIEEARVRLAETEAKITTAEEAAADWALLAKAFGKNGIPALEIDAAGPGVSALANDLLSECYSDRFRVDLQTQRLGSSDQLLEDFDIRVIDSEQGRTGSIDHLSGGEKVIVNEAVGIALAVYNKDQRHRSLYRDESAGALDAENAPKYVSMLKRAMKMGNFSQCLFVTHSPECAELADARIRCEGGSITVEV